MTRTVVSMAGETGQTSVSPLELARRIEQRIRTGEWKAGDRLPTLRALSRDAGVSFSTARNAIAHLERRGVVYSHHGSGTFVKRQTAPAEVQRGRPWVAFVLDMRPHVAGELNHHLLNLLDIRDVASMTLGWRAGMFDEFLQHALASWPTPPQAVVVQRVDEELEIALRRSLPPEVPIICQFCPSIAIPDGWHSVDPDYGAAFRMGVEHLLAQGHRRIGLVLKQRKLRGHWRHTLRKAWMPHTAAIMGAAEAIRAAGVEHGLTIHYNLEVHRDPSGIPHDPQNLQRLAQWLGQPDAPTAVIGDDYRMPAVRLAAEHLGRRVGHDLQLLAVGSRHYAAAAALPCVDLQWHQVADQVFSIVQSDPALLRQATRRLLVRPQLFGQPHFLSPALQEKPDEPIS